MESCMQQYMTKVGIFDKATEFGRWIYMDLRIEHTIYMYQTRPSHPTGAHLNASIEIIPSPTQSPSYPSKFSCIYYTRCHPPCQAPPCPLRSVSCVLLGPLRIHRTRCHPPHSGPPYTSHSVSPTPLGHIMQSLSSVAYGEPACKMPDRYVRPCGGPKMYEACQRWLGPSEMDMRRIWKGPEMNRGSL